MQGLLCGLCYRQARGILRCELRVPAFETGTVQPHAGLLQGSAALEQSHDVHTIRNALITPESARLVGGFLNTTDEPITIPAGSQYGWFTPDYGNERCQVAALSAERLSRKQDEEGLLPRWAEGPTTAANYEARAQYLIKTFKLNSWSARMTSRLS